ncbi:MAG: hypothetical protein RR739_06810, partial [Clostridia bacterium]
AHLGGTRVSGGLFAREKAHFPLASEDRPQASYLARKRRLPAGVVPRSQAKIARRRRTSLASEDRPQASYRFLRNGWGDAVAPKPPFRQLKDRVSHKDKKIRHNLAAFIRTTAPF